MRVGFPRALDKHDARDLLKAVEDDFGAVETSKSLIAKFAGRAGQLPLGSGVGIQLPEILVVDPAAETPVRVEVLGLPGPLRLSCRLRRL